MPAQLTSDSRRFALILIAIALSCVTLFGQSATRPDRGVKPNGSYSVSDIESVSLSNGNLNLSIPLASLPPLAGGELSWTISASYNSKLWDVGRSQANGNETVWQPFTVNNLQPGGGWQVGGRYQIRFVNSNEDFSRLTYPGNSGLPSHELQLLNNHQWFKVVLTTPNGAQHELRPTDSLPYSGSQDFLKGFYNVIPNGSPLRYHSIDASFIFAKISASLDWTVYLPDGTQVIQTTDGVQRIQDTNGNKIKIFDDVNGTHYQDELTGREIRVTEDPNANNGAGKTQVWYKTVGGTEHHIDVNFGTTLVAGKVYEVNAWSPTGGEGGNGEVCQTLTPVGDVPLGVVRDIVFPQTESTQPQQKFEFSYNSDTTTPASDTIGGCGVSPTTYNRNVSNGWGELSRMVTPTGAIVDYTYSFSSVHVLSNITDQISTQSLTHKKLTDGSVDDDWTYVIGDTMGGVTNPDGTGRLEQKYCSEPFTPGCSTEKAGLVYRSVKPFQIVERHWTNLAFTGANLARPGGVVAFNAVVDKEYTTILDFQGSALKMSAREYAFDYNGNITQTKEYDWFDPATIPSRDAQGVPTGVPLGLQPIRTTNHSYYNQASGASSANVYAKRSVSTGAPLILNALQQTTVGSSVVQLSYDNQNYGTAPTAGNLTSKSVWNDVDNVWITTSNTYGAHGNLATSTDARLNVTEYFYDDAQLALPTRERVDPENGTGTQTVTTVYDFHTGLVTAQTDVNGKTSTIHYTNHRLGAVDPFGRPGTTKSPSIGGQQRTTTTTYFDSARQVVVASDLNTENDQLLKTRTTMDRIGRPVSVEQTENGSTYTLLTRNAYLDMGRVTLTSNPMRPSPSPTPGTTDSWTRITKDLAGRVTEVATFGGYNQPAWDGTSGAFTGRVLTTYEGEFITVSDHTGRLRRSKTDALGRLVRVDEPDASNNLGTTSSPVQPTGYEYDVFDNLTKVTQASQAITQTRNFGYDTMSRLRTAQNPESGTVIYQYDENGNLIVKTDARGISAHFSYDSLNRVTRKWFNTSNSPGVDVHSPPSTLGTTAEVSYKYDTQTVPGGPSYLPGASVGRLVAQVYGTGSTTGDYFAYDVLGRPTLKIQRTGTKDYDIQASYSLSGAITQLTYPSTRSVTNTYDSAGRLSATAGNLGGGSSRTYSTGILYSPTGSLVKEQFGTATPIFNKLFYNSRGQLAEIRESTSYTGPDDTTWDRGAIINFYSDQCWGMCADGNGPQAMSDNNGNLLKQAVYIPGATMKWQQYSYDSLNRLQWAREILDGGSEQWRQWFKYDRWGNRTFDFTVEQGVARTYGGGLVNKVFEVEESTNRLLAQNDTPLAATNRKMRYDAAGNLENDSWSSYGTDTSGVVTRKYDGDNRMTSAWNSSGGVSDYTYDGSGNRIKRKTGNSETWLVYGIGGELIAEYPADGAKASPQKEYGYRNGQLLITAEPPVETQPSMNVALTSNGGTATASSTLDSGRTALAAINGDRKGQHWGTDPSTGSGWHCATNNVYPDTLEVAFNGSKTISEVDIFAVQDNYTSPVEPTEAMTASIVGITAFSVEYWNGSSWATIPGTNVTGNTKVWRKFTFSPITTDKIRVSVTGAQNFYSRIAEVEAWTPGPAPNPRVNVAMTAHGGSATASSTLDSGRTPLAAINGDRKGQHWGTDPATGSGWHDATNGTWPDSIEVLFAGSKVIDELNVISVQDDPGNPIEPTLSTTFTQYGASAFKAFYWDGSQWVLIPGIDITGNNKVWRQFTFSAITTTKIKLEISASPNQTWAHSRVVELEAFGTNPTTPVTAKLQWLVADQLGTPRMIFDETGSLANMKRHDYAPFGEELIPGVSGRTTAQGYGGGDGVRQQFTSKERDTDTGLDYFFARYVSSLQGRFTSPDEFKGGADELFVMGSGDSEKQALAYADITNPISLNKYQFCFNNPLRYVDHDGHDGVTVDSDMGRRAVQSVLIATGPTLWADGIHRGRYAKGSKLRRSEPARDLLKQHTRENMSIFGGEVSKLLDKSRQGAKHTPGSATRTSPLWNKVGKGARVAGPIATAGAVVFSVQNVVSAEPGTRAQAAVVELGGWAGAAIGASAGTAAGAKIGAGVGTVIGTPGLGTAVGAGAGGIIGGAAGGIIGSGVAEHATKHPPRGGPYIIRVPIFR